MEQKKLIITHKKGRKDSFILLPLSQHCSAVRGNSQASKYSSQWKMERRVSDHFPSYFGHHTKDPLWIHSIQRLANLRHMEMARNKEEKQDLSVSAASWEWVTAFPSHLLCRQPWQLSPLKKTMTSRATVDALQISCFPPAPQVFAFADTSYVILSPFLPHTYCKAQDLNLQPVQFSAAEQVQGSSPDPCSYLPQHVCSQSSPSSCALACHYLIPNTKLHVLTHGNIFQPKKCMLIVKAPTTACGPGLEPITGLH